MVDRALTPPPPHDPPLTRDRNARAKRPAGRGVQSQGDSRLTHATQTHVWFPAQGGGRCATYLWPLAGDQWDPPTLLHR